METMIIYLLKSALILGGFLAVYHLFLKKDTHFLENRLFLVTGLLLSLIFPLIKIQNTIVADKPLLIASNGSASSTTLKVVDNGIINMENAALALYLTVFSVLLIRFLLQLYSLKKLEKNANIWKEHPFLHVETEKKISPFSFFNHIFYNPTLFEPKELGVILTHEKVHARQLHTLDILLLEIFKIVFWFNPVIWFYKTAIKQNLEYLADHYTVERAENIKTYQYLMLRQAMNKPEYSVSNSFYNSLIKKRIVMLNQNQSKKISVLKTLLIVPLLGLFLVSFSVEDIYQYPEDDLLHSTKDDKSVELVINKNTTNAELDKLKKDLAEDGIDFSYTTVRNENKEIIGITLHLSGKNSKGSEFSGNYNCSSEDPIKPFSMFYDDDTNTVSFGNAKHINFHTDGSLSLETDNIVWTSDDKTEVIIRKDNDIKTVIVDGKRLSDEEMEEMEIEKGTSVFIGKDEDEEGEKKKIKVERLKKDGNHITIVKDSDDEEDIEVIGDDSSFFFIDNDGKGEPLYYIDGKKATSKEVKKLSQSSIESVNVFKGKEAIKKYGKKAKNGVVEITTKKE